MLLGEARPFEEEQLREQLKTDAALARFCAEIEKTLPVLKEALDVGQAGKVKSPKPRLAGKRRSKLKQLFRSDTGLAKRRIVRLDFRKTLAIAAAVCVVLFIAAGLLLPRLSKAGSSAERISANQTKGIADSEATQVAESKPNFTQDTLTATAGFSMVETGENRPDSTLLGESFGRSLRIDGEAGQLALPTGAVSTHGAVVTAIPGLANGEATAESALNRNAYELSYRGRGVNQRDHRKFADLSMPESEYLAESPSRSVNQGMTGSSVANWEGRARALVESKEVEGFDVNGALATVQKNPAAQTTSPAGQPASMFESGYANSASDLTPKPADGVNLYGFQHKYDGESSGQPAMTSEPMPHGIAESNFVPPPPGGAGERGSLSLGINSLYSIEEAGEPKTIEFFKRPTLNGPTTVPTPQAGAKVVDDNGNAYSWHFENADKSGLNTSANPDVGARYMRHWEIPQPDKMGNQQWAVRDETWKKANPVAGMGTGGGGMGGGGYAGGDGALADGFVMGEQEGMGMPKSSIPSPTPRFAMPAPPGKGIPEDSISGRAPGAFGLSLDGDGLVESNGKLTTFKRGQAQQQVKQAAQALGTEEVRRLDGRANLQSPEDESEPLGQSVNVITEMLEASANESNASGLPKYQAERVGELSDLDQSGAVDFFFDAQLSPAKGGAPDYVAQEEQAKEGDKEEDLMLGDVPALGRLFNNRIEAETAGRELDQVQQFRIADEKARVQRSSSSRFSGRGRSTQLKTGLAELQVEEYESLAKTVDETKLIPGTSQRQLLRGKSLDSSRKRAASKKPQSLSEGKDLLRRKGKPAANKELSAPKPKPQSAERLSKLSLAKREEKGLEKALKELASPAKPPAPSVVYTPRPETLTAQNNFSTFSLNVSDVSFKTTLASLQADKLPEPGDVRSEEFLNALEYRDPMPGAGEPLAFHWERARSPFTHDRDIIRFSVRTAALGRQPGRAINLVCLLDNSGSMEREDRVSIVQQALGVLARKLTPNDRVSLVTFSRTPKLRIDGMRGGNREAFLKASTGWIPQGGTHVEKALALAYQTAKKHFIPGGNNRVVLLTDGAANMGNVDPYQLRKTVESHRKQGIALDCFGVGWEGYNDNLLEVLARNGDGRYGFLNQPVQAVAEFEQKLLGAFQVAASDVKVQVEWNADRVRVFRQVGYLRHQLKKEDFRNNKIDAAEISAAESGNALYVVQVDPGGQGPLGMVRVRYKVPFTREYTEMEWSLAYESAAAPLEQASPALRLGSVAATFAEWLAQNPYAQGVQLADLQGLISGIPSIYATDPRPAQLEWMIGKARILAGN